MDYSEGFGLRFPDLSVLKKCCEMDSHILHGKIIYIKQYKEKLKKNIIK